MTDALVVSVPRNPADTLSGFEEWEHFMEERYPTPLEGQIVPPPMQRTMQRRDGYRDYRAAARPGVKECFLLNHLHRPLELAKAKQKDFGRLNRKEMSVARPVNDHGLGDGGAWRFRQPNLSGRLLDGE
jgi:hypothetical protein